MSAICALRGHDPIAVREVGLVARPGGMLPSTRVIPPAETEEGGE